MTRRKPVPYRHLALAGLIICSLGSQFAGLAKNDNYETSEATSATDDAIAPSKSFLLHGKAEVIEGHDNTLHAAEGSRMYQRGVLCLSTKRYGVAADCFKSAGDQFALSTGNEKFLAEARFAEAQSRRMLGEKQAATLLYREAAELFQQYDPHSQYLKAALDNLNMSTGLHGHAAQSQLKSMTGISGIQSVEREVYLKGNATDLDGGTESSTFKGKSDVTTAFIKKTVLQAFVKMTCLETAELGSNYYTAADRYMPLKANGKTVALSASSGFLAPVIRIRLNGRFYNVGVDLPELASSKRTVYLVTDGMNVLAIDPGNYDVWKLYAMFKKSEADFEWRRLTHTKDRQRRLNLP